MENESPDRGGVLRVMNIAGIDTSDGPIQGEIDSLVEAVSQIAGGKNHRESGTIIRCPSWPDGARRIYPCGAGFVLGYAIWTCAGVIAYVRLTRRIQR
jgi:hypothetical protein